MEEEYFKYDFILNLDRVICSECGFKEKQTLSISHIAFFHELINPDCNMVSYINIKYHNYSFYNALLFIYESSKTRKYVFGIEKCMLKTFNKSVQIWPKCLLKAEELVSDGLFYTGEEGEVMCIECKVVLYDWKNTDTPWSEHIKASPDCMLVKLHQI